MTTPTMVQLMNALKEANSVISEFSGSFSKNEKEAAMVNLLPAIQSQVLRCDVIRKAIAEVIMLLSEGKDPEAKISLQQLYIAISSLQRTLIYIENPKLNTQSDSMHTTVPDADIPF